MRSDNYDESVYDVTYLVPDFERNTSSTGCINKVAPTNSRRKEITETDNIMELLLRSVGECVDKHDELKLADGELLESNPIKLLVENTLGGFQWWFRLFLVIHLVYMTAFSMSTLPTAEDLATRDSCVKLPSKSEAFLIWPIFTAVFVMSLDFFVVKDQLKMYRKNFKLEVHYFAALVINLPEAIATVVGIVLSPQTILLLFSVVSIVWSLCQNQCLSRETHVYLSAAVLILGWMSTFYFVRSAIFITYNKVMKNYNFSYILCFLFIYCCILLGFGLAFHVMFQLSSKMEGNEALQPAGTLRSVLQLWFGDGNPLNLINDTDFFADYSSDGGKPELVYGIYVIYVFGTVILLNTLLTASLTNVAESNHMSRIEIAWRVQVLRVCYWMERRKPWIVKMRHRVSPYRMVNKDGRLWMHVPKQPITDKNDLLRDIYDILLKQQAQKNPSNGKSQFSV
jgi:hypothetical protein